MKRKLVMKLLAGCLSVTMLSPFSVWAAEPSQENEMAVQAEQGVQEKIEAPQPEEEPEQEGKKTEDSAVLQEQQPESEVSQNVEEKTQSEQQPEEKFGWEIREGRWTYTFQDGTTPKEFFEEIEDEIYYFDEEGWMVTQWQKIQGQWYYFNASGHMLTGWQHLGGSWYYLDAKGKMLTSWQQLEGSWYYLDSSGRMLTGWNWVNGKCYYLKDSGAMAADTWIDGYYVDKSGAWIPGKIKEEQQSGWILDGNRWWYRHADGSYTKSDWEKINGKWYYFDSAGWMTTDWQLVKGSWYYLSGSGEMLTGWQLVKGNWYYLDGSGRMLTGWRWINGKCYYLNQSGAMASDTWVGNYYVDKSGAWIPDKASAGWISSGNRWWYRHADGSYTKSDWEKINGKWYYFDANGWMLTGWQRVRGIWYYLDGSGAMLTGWQYIGDKWYYLSGSGAMLTGWQFIGGKWYYLESSGAMASDTWIGEYYVNASGVWEEGKQSTGWQQSNGRWYYINTDGSRAKSTWKNIDGSDYYFDADGWMVTGWLKLGKNYYYLKENGAKAVDYWVGTTGVGGYYINKYGVMVADSTYSVGDTIYTFDSNGLCTGKEERYVRVKDKNGRTYKVEKQFQTDPQVGVDVTEDEFLAVAVYAEAGNQGMPGMTGVALVMLNRMNTTREGAASPYPSQANIMIYQAQQFEVARNGALTKYLKDIDSSYLKNAKAAVSEARKIIDVYNEKGTPRQVEGLTMPEGKTDFNYMGFMTPKAFENANLDWEKTEAFTYMNTTFYTTWIKKR